MIKKRMWVLNAAIKVTLASLIHAVHRLGWERKSKEEREKALDAVVCAVAFSVKRFSHGSDWRENIDEVLQHVGKAAGVRSISLYENESGDLRASMRHNWTASGADTQLLPHSFSYQAGDLESRFSLLPNQLNGLIPGGKPGGHIWKLQTEDAPEMLLIPVFVGSAWWGVFAIADSQRVWRVAELNALQTVGDALGAAILRQQHETGLGRAQQLVETVPEGVILLDRARRIVLWNPAGQAFLSLLADVRVGDVLERLDGRPLEEILGAATDDRRWVELQARESKRVFELTERPVEDGKEIGGCVLVIREITAEWERRQHMQNQERLATVGQLAAGIAHDFNNVMTIITLYSQALERNPDFHKRDQYLATISQQARNASQLISQILDFSRRAVIEAGPLELQPFVAEVVKLLQRTLPEEISITFDAGEGSFLIEGDPTRLQQVLLNLALNARDAMPEGGRLEIKLDHVQIRPDQKPPVPEMLPGDWIRMTVADTGAGIAPADIANIFDPFFTTKERGKGTGLGLAQVYGIVKQHGGEIRAESVPGEGATFSIYLPAHSTADQQAVHSGQPAAKERIRKERRVDPTAYFVR